MSVKFFGQFLLERGEIDSGHLREALVLLDRENRSVGEIAVREGWLSAADAERVNRAQRTDLDRFGDLAVKMELLSRDQLVDCLRIQQQGRIRIGEALVRLGHLAEERLAPLLDEFKIDQAPYQLTSSCTLPDSLANHRVASCVLDLLPKFALRIAHMQLKIGDAQTLVESPPFRMRVSIAVRAHRGLEIILVGDRHFCCELAKGTSGLVESALDDDLILDAVGEFLNILAGNAVAVLERGGVSAQIGVPDCNASLDDGWIFDLAASRGRAALVLSPF